MRTLLSRHLPVLFAASLLSACATQIKPTQTTNPPPEAAFSAYQNHVVQPLEVDGSAGDVSAAAVEKIQRSLDANATALAQSWAAGAPTSARGRLTFQPRVLELKFVNGFTRFMAGMMAGSSAVRMELVVTDQGTGQVIAQPEFYRAAKGNGITMSLADNKMLDLIGADIADYMRRNYRTATGGPVSQ